MRILNKLVYACCSIAFGLMALPSCEGGELYDVKDTRNMALIVLIPQTILWPITPNGVPISSSNTPPAH